MKGHSSLSVSALTATFAVLQKTRPGNYDDHDGGCDDDHDVGNDGNADENEGNEGGGEKVREMEKITNVEKWKEQSHDSSILPPFHGRWLGAGNTASLALGEFNILLASSHQLFCWPILLLDGFVKSFHSEVFHYPQTFPLLS